MRPTNRSLGPPHLTTPHYTTRTDLALVPRHRAVHPPEAEAAGGEVVFQNVEHDLELREDEDAVVRRLVLFFWGIMLLLD